MVPVEVGSVPPGITSVGTVAELWRYPVKSMGGEFCDRLEVVSSGVCGDRRLAVQSSAAPPGRPLLSSAERQAMLRYRASITSTGEGQVLVHTPEGKTFSAEDNRLLQHLRAAFAAGADLKLLQVTDQERPFTDVRPVALHSVQTVHKLSTETGESFDARRLRSNIVLDLTRAEGFAEDGFAGRWLKIGTAVLQVKERIPRCRMVSLHPETAMHDPAILRQMARTHGGRAGIYARVEIPGKVHLGDPVILL